MNTLLQNYSSEEKTAYLRAISSLATADRSASEEEIEYLTELSAKAGLSGPEIDSILESAREEREDSLAISLGMLKSSELRFSLIADLIHFANVDQNYSAEERVNVEKIAEFLNVSQEQYSALDQFVDHTKDKTVTPEEVNQPSFLAGTGIQEKLKAAGIDLGSLTKGLLGTLAPLILGKVLGGRSSGGGIPGLGSGGLGSLISGLARGRSGSSGSGGLLGNILSQLTR